MLCSQVRASRVPTPDEDKEVMHAAFLSAYGQSGHGPRIKGMQEFAGAVRVRRVQIRHMPYVPAPAALLRRFSLYATTIHRSC